MKAVFIERFGGPEVLTLGDLPEPAPGSGEVLVDIHAASVNPADCRVREGARQNIVAPKFPQILGRDFSGVVRSVGAGVTDLKPGDEVFAVTDNGKDGAYAEAITIAAAICAKKPAFLSHVEAAALALIGLTALVAIEDTIKLKKGETILIQGGAGGVGSFAVQLAHHIGARVLTTASARNRDYLRKLGADQVIDYTKEDFTKIAHDCDAVFDTVGGEVQARSLACVKPGGRFSWVAGAELAAKPPANIKAQRPAVGRDRPHLERIVALAQAGAVKVPEITVLQLSEAQKAHALSDAKHVRGKLVFKVR
jgi:NADPH:quinone reductase-like Zn-dependent oxidoreductase